MRIKLIFFTLITITIARAYAADDSAHPFIAEEAFARSSLVGMQLSVHQAQQQGKIPAAVSACVQSLDNSSFIPTFKTLLAQNLSKDELQATEEFFSTPVGRKYSQHGLMQVYTSVGETPPEALPVFSSVEYQELEKFSRTTAGEKLILKKVFQGAPAQQVIGSQIQALLGSCRANQNNS